MKETIAEDEAREARKREARLGKRKERKQLALVRFAQKEAGWSLTRRTRPMVKLLLQLHQSI
jgi:hypothetical protein